MTNHIISTANVFFRTLVFLKRSKIPGVFSSHSSWSLFDSANMSSNCCPLTLPTSWKTFFAFAPLPLTTSHDGDSGMNLQKYAVSRKVLKQYRLPSCENRQWQKSGDNGKVHPVRKCRRYKWNNQRCHGVAHHHHHERKGAGGNTAVLNNYHMDHIKMKF